LVWLSEISLDISFQGWIFLENYIIWFDCIYMVFWFLQTESNSYFLLEKMSLCEKICIKWYFFQEKGDEGFFLERILNENLLDWVKIKGPLGEKEVWVLIFENEWKLRGTTQKNKERNFWVIWDYSNLFLSENIKIYRIALRKGFADF